MEKNMKPVWKMSILAATIFLAVGCQKEDKSDAKPAEPAKVEQVATSAAADTAKVDFKTEDQKAAYAIGSSLGQYLVANLEQQKEMGLVLDKADVLAGVQDAFAGTSKLTPEQAQQALQELDQRAAKLAEQKLKAEAEQNLKAGDEFRAKFAKEAGVVTTKSGLMYKVEKEGTGPKPTATDTVEVHYKGTLIDGTVFDSSYQRKQTVSFPLNQVIPGWTEGVQLMPVGSKFEFVIPPQLAYGAQSNPSIPANSTLIFQVELVGIKAPAEKAVDKAASAETKTK